MRRDWGLFRTQISDFRFIFNIYSSDILAPDKPQQRRSLKKLIVAYGDRVLMQQRDDVKKEYLGIDEGLMQQELVPANIAQQCDDIDWDNYVKPIIEGGAIKQPMFVRLLKDEPNPISLIVMKIKEVGDESYFIVRVRSGNYEGMSDEDLVAADDSIQDRIGEHGLNMKNGSFTIPHRFVREDYRGAQNETGERLGDIMLTTCEQIVKSYANKEDSAKNIEIDARQLDVMLWADKNEYRARSSQQDMVDRIFDANEDFSLGEDLRVFPSSVPPNQRTWEHEEQAIDKIYFSKTIQPDITQGSADPGLEAEEGVHRENDATKVTEIIRMLGVQK